MVLYALMFLLIPFVEMLNVRSPFFRRSCFALLFVFECPKPRGLRFSLPRFVIFILFEMLFLSMLLGSRS